MKNRKTGTISAKIKKITSMTSKTSPGARKALIERVTAFISANRSGALATVDSDGNPHAAVVLCVVDADLSIYFSTSLQGRKFTNILSRPTVAAVFYDEEEVQAIQMTGFVEQVKDIHAAQIILHELMKKRYHDPSWPVPSLRLFDQENERALAIIKMTPAEMTFADFRTSKTGHYKASYQKII